MHLLPNQRPISPPIGIHSLDQLRLFLRSPQSACSRRAERLAMDNLTIHRFGGSGSWREMFSFKFFIISFRSVRTREYLFHGRRNGFVRFSEAFPRFRTLITDLFSRGWKSIFHKHGEYGAIGRRVESVKKLLHLLFTLLSVMPIQCGNSFQNGVSTHNLLHLTNNAGKSALYFLNGWWIDKRCDLWKTKSGWKGTASSSSPVKNLRKNL